MKCLRQKSLHLRRVYLDLQNAFDTINHEILLSKLKHYGIKGTSYNWLKSFLCERTQYTLIKEKESSLKTVSHGVPQGSVLGLLLFILFFNDMHNSVEYCKTPSYLLMTPTSFFLIATSKHFLLL